MALFDALLTNGGAADPGMADSGTAINLLKQKYPGMFAATDAPGPARASAFQFSRANSERSGTGRPELDSRTRRGGTSVECNG